MSGQIQTIANLLSEKSELLSKAVVYPATNYPGRTEEFILNALLRKKLDPNVETWVEEGRSVNAAASAESDREEEELWAWAGKSLTAWMGKYIEDGIFQDNYTIEEREKGIENVNTGLKRKFEDEDDDDESDEDEDEDGEDDDTNLKTNPPKPAKPEVIKDPNEKSLEAIARFGTTGREA